MALSILALIDDIATLMDDVASLTKIATKKTSGVLSDDLALNAQNVVGIRPEREIPVVLKIAKGSLINKVILVPLALLLSAFLPMLITPLLLLGGLYLCFEGAEKVIEKILEKIFHKKHKSEIAIEEKKVYATKEEADKASEELEKLRVSSAVKTDFILSAEIIIITLGTVATEIFLRKALVLSAVSIIITIGVYFLVGLLVKIDDIGLHLSIKNNALVKKLGLFMVNVTPKIMKGLGILGTVAMFLVGGGIISHASYEWTHWSLLHNPYEHTTNLILGFTAGAILVLIHHIYHKLSHKNEH